MLYFDVSKRQKTLICAFIIRDKDNQIVEAKTTRIQTDMGTNCGECLSLIFGLEKAKELGIKNIKVFGDSLIIINQTNGIFKIKHPKLKELHRQVDLLKQCFEQIEFNWIPRHQNSDADRLTK